MRLYPILKIMVRIEWEAFLYALSVVVSRLVFVVFLLYQFIVKIISSRCF